MRPISWGATFVLFLFCSASYPQALEFGDAPEGAVAYPSLGITGSFPTCKTVGPGMWIQHNNFGAWFGPAFDFEPDGNAGLCPAFSPYDMDECYSDGDAGLILPLPYTIVNNQVVPCSGPSGSPLGLVCQTAVWGQSVDIIVHNTMPSQTTGFLNILFDWDQNGSWGGSAPCPGGPAPEHVLINFPVPNGFIGPLSLLAPPPFVIGPFGGFCWARFSITEMPVPVPWDASGSFEDGESEDYLIAVAVRDFGDAPEGSLAYPASGMIGGFPTCIGVGSPPTFIQHQSIMTYFGPNADDEADGNAGFCSPFTPPYDSDECMSDMDAGLMVPASYTISGAPGSEVVSPCVPGTGNPLDTICGTVAWGTELDILVNNLYYDTAYFNLLCDWNQDGTWVYDANTMCSSIVPEHAVVNFVVPPGYTGPISVLLPPSFIAGPHPGFVWTRFSLTEVPVVQNWDGSGLFGEGESEDYLLELFEVPIIEADMGDAPEGALAYPAGSTQGNFPTCLTAGPSGSFVQHLGISMFLGFSFDMETDGNAGICNPFGFPYDNDECFGDGDAGLLMPGSYTITGSPGSETVTVCPQSGGGFIDTACNTVSWGPQIDIQINNFSNLPGYFNALFDWNMDGQWLDDTNTLCNSAVVPEHALVDFPVPAGYIGPLSALLPPTFIAGPDSGYVWSRMTLSNVMVGPTWDGSGVFEDGETEDYLMLIAGGEEPIEEAEFGDAPEGVLAYPASGTFGNFPTCLFVGTGLTYIRHFTMNLYFGPAYDTESDGNAGLCNPFLLPYDNDECMGDGDAGLVIPLSYTITGSPGSENVVPCQASGSPLDTICYMVKWGMDLDINVVNNGNDAYFNLLVDWNQDGMWADQPATQCNSIMIPEHVVVNFLVPAGFVGPISALGPPSFQAGPNSGYLWSRFSLTEMPVNQNWDGSGNFQEGETEDYLLELDLATSINPLGGSGYDNGMKIYPNPAVDKFNIDFETSSAGAFEFRIKDLRGVELCRYLGRVSSEGQHSIVLVISECGLAEFGAGMLLVEQWQGKAPVARGKLVIRH